MTDLDKLNAQNAALSAALIRERSTSLALQAFGDTDFAPLFAGCLAVVVEDSTVHVHAVDRAGKPITRFDMSSKKLRPLHADEVIAEVRERHPTMPWRANDVTANGQEGKQVKPRETDAELLARIHREHGAVQPALTNEQRAAARRSNPFAPGSLNLTEQCRLLKFDPALAAELQAAVA